MIPPKIPDDEDESLAVLYQLNILDTAEEERFNRITRIACKLFSVPMASINFMEAERQWMKSNYGLSIQEAKRDTSFCGHVILSNDIMVVEDAKSDKRFHDNPFVIGAPYFRFYLGCPLQIKNVNVGTICLIDNKPRLLNDIDLSIAKDLSDMVVLELEALHLSTTDELTSLSNRRGFLKLAGHLFHLCQRENKPFSLLFFDLDKFKLINDTFGHAEGDSVLKVFSKILLEHFRSYDIVARLGGDEFCVFTSGLESKDINQVIHRLKKALLAFNAKANKGYHIEFSVGSIQFDSNTHSNLSDMLKLADSNMYTNKKRQ